MCKQVSRRVGGDFSSSASKNHHEGHADRIAAVPVLEKTAGQTEPKGEEVIGVSHLIPAEFINNKCS